MITIHLFQAFPHEIGANAPLESLRTSCPCKSIGTPGAVITKTNPVSLDDGEFPFNHCWKFLKNRPPPGRRWLLGCGGKGFFLVGRFGKSGWVSSLLLGVEDSPPVSVTTGSLFFSVLGIPNNRHSPMRYTLETNQASRHRRKNSELLFCDEILQLVHWLVVSTPLKNISQIGIISPNRGEHKNIWWTTT